MILENHFETAPAFSLQRDHLTFLGDYLANIVALCYNTISLNLERRIAMPISYDKLWKLLIDKKMNRTDLKDASGISFNVLAKMGKNEFVSMESLHKICLTLKCDVGDIMEFIDEGDTEQS